MYPAQIRRRLFLSAGVSTTAVAMVAAAALPAFAGPPIGQGNSSGNGNANDHGKVSGHTSGHGNGRRKNPIPSPTPTSRPSGPTKTGSEKNQPGKTKASSPSNDGKGSTSVPPGQAKKSSPPGNSSNTGGANGNGSGHNPPGNNGTVKIHQVANDPSHHDVPHVSCNFYVDFWGFDQDQILDVSFAGQAPTGNMTPVTFAAPDGTEIVSPDPAGGGNDFDGELAFEATANSLAVLGTPQAQQGYHVKLTVTTHQPGGHKYKVFWVQPCDSVTTPTSTTAAAFSTTLGASGGTTSASPGKARVLAVHLTRALPHRVKSAPVLQSLPFTGAEIGGMVIAGLAALGTGTLMTIAGRRRRQIIALK